MAVPITSNIFFSRTDGLRTYTWGRSDFLVQFNRKYPHYALRSSTQIIVSPGLHEHDSLRQMLSLRKYQK